MGQQYTALSEQHIQFIRAQKMFFVGTASANSRVNVSPKGMDSLRVCDNTRVLWCNLTGSGNETAAHVQLEPRMTIMFCAFEGSPMILRLYGQAKAIHKTDVQWEQCTALFPALPGLRQFFDMTIDMVQTSCGMGVPFFNYQNDRQSLKDWALKRGEKGIHDYWLQKNQQSIDAIPTHIVKKNLGLPG